MDWFRKHWFDVGGVLAVVISLFLFFNYTGSLSFRTLLWISFIALLLHQVEEYRFPGYFPQIINKTLYGSIEPDRYPLNPQTALLINLGLGWVIYLLAIAFADKGVWVAIVSIMVSVGNIIAHVFLFNIKGKTLYNPGMVTALVLFLPISVYFFLYIFQNNLAQPSDYIIGIILGILVNYFGVIKAIDLLKDKKTKYYFAKRLIEK